MDDEQIEPTAESLAVTAWRREEFLRVGIGEPYAEMLAADPAVAVETARRMRDKGWTVERMLSVLL